MTMPGRKPQELQEGRVKKGGTNPPPTNRRPPPPRPQNPQGRYPKGDGSGPNQLYPLAWSHPHDIRAKATGEFRAPMAGEWFLSGAVVQAYRAAHDFTPNDRFHIARLVRVKVQTITVVTEVES